MHPKPHMISSWRTPSVHQKWDVQVFCLNLAHCNLMHSILLVKFPSRAAVTVVLAVIQIAG